MIMKCEPYFSWRGERHFCYGGMLNWETGFAAHRYNTGGVECCGRAHLLVCSNMATTAFRGFQQEAPDILTSLSMPARFCIGIGVVQLGFFVYKEVVPRVFAGADRLRHRGKHLDEFGALDWTYITTNKALTWVMVYHTLTFLLSSPHIVWAPGQLSMGTTLGALIALFVVYDFFYSLIHRVLHVRGIYGHIHKHHHRQVVPTRGSLDAINVHPIEYLLGEYTHVLSLFLVSTFVCRVHAATPVIFLALGGVAAALNHTRFDVRLRLPFAPKWPLFDVRAHDTHHCIPNSNYGQYTMLWDWVMGTYKEYDAGRKAS